MNTLPYPKYSWNFTQHAIGMNPGNLFPLLSAASIFEGHSKFADKINKILITESVLTKNIRNGKSDAWRDYQQILAELGLIVSTKINRQLALTEIGRLFLCGELGFTELMNIQSLRYQYPNGLKSQFIPQQLNANVRIKPGVLLLRILCELVAKGKKNFITVTECQNNLIPITNQDDWHVALFNFNKNKDSLSININRHARRNIQDWYKFLNHTDIFKIIRIGREDAICLTKKVLADISTYSSLCKYAEKPENFWMPYNTDKMTLSTWFHEFGHIPSNYFILLEKNLTKEYLNNNYYVNPEMEVGVEAHNGISQSSKISLSEIPESGIEPNKYTSPSPQLKINSGEVKRAEKAKLHDEIINKLAKHYRGKGFRVFDDRNSIDLVVQNEKTDVSIFEVKTATFRNLIPRSRLAIGQILEYGYRYNNDFGVNPKKNIVFNVDVENSSWFRKYVNAHLGIGLFSVYGEKIKSFTPQEHPS